MKKILKILCIIFIVLLLSFLCIYLLQDKSKLLEDRKYKDINKLVINSEVSDINFYKSEDEFTRVVIYGLSKDKVELVEGNKELSIDKHGSKSYCLINCDNKIDIYLPNDLDSLNITTDVGSVNTESVYVSSLTIKSDVGSINVGVSNIVNIITNVGSVSIKEISGTDNSLVKTDVGSITIDKISNLKVESNVDFGNNDIVNNDGEFILKLETNVGSVKVKEYENKSE